MIRLSRRGARKQPYYRIVVIEKDRARDGRSVEVVGTYNPRTNPASVELKRERIDYWTGKGAQLSDRVKKLIEKDRARDGRSVEVVGTYNPRTNPATVELKSERVDYWTSKGAQVSDRVKKLLEKAPASASPATETTNAA